MWLKVKAKEANVCGHIGVGKHFCEKSHEIHDMSIVIIEEVKSKNPFVLKAREAYWIKQYDAVNHGLNLEE